MSGFEIVGAVTAAGQFIEQSITLFKLGKALHRKVRDELGEI